MYRITNRKQTLSISKKCFDEFVTALYWSVNVFVIPFPRGMHNICTLLCLDEVTCRSNLVIFQHLVNHTIVPVSTMQWEKSKIIPKNSHRTPGKTTTIQVTAKPCHIHMMASSNGNIFRVTGHLYGEFTGHRWIPHTKASDAELWCFRSSACE